MTVASTVQTNQEFIRQLDEEGILLSDYLGLLLEKMLVEKGLIKTKDADQFLHELS